MSKESKNSVRVRKADIKVKEEGVQKDFGHLLA